MSTLGYHFPEFAIGAVVSVPPSRDGRERAEVMNGRSAPRAVICAHRTRGSVGRCHGLTERLLTV